jgi:hypothetical protein
VREEVEGLGAFPEAPLVDIRKMRNRITHEGFSSIDDSASIGLIIEVGLPFLAECYKHLYSFDMWDSILEDYVKQWKIAASVYQRAKNVPELDPTYCLRSFIHLVQWNLKDNFSPDWEMDALARAEEIGIGFELKQKMQKRLEYSHDPSWVFDCPLCNYSESAVCELEYSEDYLGAPEIIPLRMTCTHCGFIANTAHQFLSQALLEKQVKQAKHQILKDAGL